MKTTTNAPDIDTPSAPEIIAPEMPLLNEVYFDDEGNPVAISMPHDPENEPDDEGQDSSRADITTVLGEFCRMMTTSASALQAGQRVLVLAYLMGKTDCRTHRDLAERLNVSAGRVSQILREIPAEFHSLCRLKGRTAKARATGEG